MLELGDKFIGSTNDSGYINNCLFFFSFFFLRSGCQRDCRLTVIIADGCEVYRGRAAGSGSRERECTKGFRENVYQFTYGMGSHSW